MPDAETDQVERKTAFAHLFNDHLAGEEPPAPSPAPAPGAFLQQTVTALAAPVSHAPRPRARRSEEDEAAASGRTKYTVYIDAERKKTFEALAENTFFDTRGEVTKSDVHDAIVAYGLLHAGEIVAELIRNASLR